MLVGLAADPWMAKLGVFLAGAGFSLVFPALGVVAVKAVPQHNPVGSALATYTVFMDLSLGITGPLAGLLMAPVRGLNDLSGGGGTGGDSATAGVAIEVTSNIGVMPVSRRSAIKKGTRRFLFHFRRGVNSPRWY